MSEKQVEGTVSWFNDGKGYGFIELDGQKGKGMDVFVHFTAIKRQGFRSLREGQRVKFLVVQGEKGLQAAEVEPLD